MSATPRDRLRRVSLPYRHLLALALYGLASLVLTWPLARRMTTHMPGNGIDDPALAWNLWWIKVRLVEQLNPDLFHVGWMFHPIDINLAFYTLTPLNGLLSVPLQSATTLILANNLLLLSSYVLGAYGLYLLVQTVWAKDLVALPASTRWWIAWLSGIFYAFAAPKLFYAALGQYNIASSHWLPFCLLYVWRTLQDNSWRGSLRNGLLAGLFLTLQAWAELTYASFLILAILFCYLWFTLFWILRNTSSAALVHWQKVTGGFAVTATTFTVGILPFLWAMLPDLRVEGDFFASGGGFADAFSADLLGYLLPVRLHPLWGDWVASLPISGEVGQQIFLGYSLMALVALGWWYARQAPVSSRAANLWFALLAMAFLLSLGPALRVAGEEYPIPGPFALVSQLPFFSGNRYPSRYSVLLLAAAAVLSVRGLIFLTAKTERAWRGWMMACIAVLFLLEHIAIPLPLNDFRTPSIYTRLATEPGDFAVLELPTGWRNGARVMGRSDELIMMQQWYQTTHGKRRLGGNTSRNPRYKFQYFSQEPVLADLIALMNADRPHLEPVLTETFGEMVTRGQAQAPELLNFLGVRFILLHLESAPELLVQYIEEALPVRLVETWQGENWRGEASTIRLYALSDADRTSVSNAVGEIGMGESAALRNLGEGWSPAARVETGRYATRSQPTLLLDLPAATSQLTLTYATSQTVTYSLNGSALGQRSGLAHQVMIDDAIATLPVDHLELQFHSPPLDWTTLVDSPSAISSTGYSLAEGVGLFVQSAGEEVGNFATIHVNGNQVVANQRGYNLAALTQEGDVLATATFDTHDPALDGESARMAVWLRQWQQGTIIAGAVADEASINLTEEAVKALSELGVVTDLRGRFRQSHAFIAVQGAPPGSALEATSMVRPARVWLGAPVNGSTAYGPLIKLEYRPAE